MARKHVDGHYSTEELRKLLDALFPNNCAASRGLRVSRNTIIAWRKEANRNACLVVDEYVRGLPSGRERAAARASAGL